MSCRTALVLIAVCVLSLPLMMGGCVLFPPTTPGEPNTPDPNTPEPEPNTPPPAEKTLHEKIFTDIITAGYQGPQSCLYCHETIAEDLLDTAHWRWEGVTANIVGEEGQLHGKQDLLNNFCIGVPSNEGRCSQCHPSYGWKDKTFDFESTANVDCLVCHDTTGTYRKHPNANGGGGAASLLIDGKITTVGPEQLQQVAYNVGKPSRSNCGLCHFFAGGGDSVKKGDMATDLIAPSRDLDVHMGGLNFTCQQCHGEEKHGIAGFTLHSVDEGGDSPRCTRCHGETNTHQANPDIAGLLNLHLERVACETCHIPTFARGKPTLVDWDWSAAGQDISPIPTDQYGLPAYDKMKGAFVWGKNVKPEYRWHNGKWQRRIIGVSDTYTNAGTPEDPVVMAAPVATKDDPDAKITPFKKMVGRQPADVVNQRIIVPHLFGSAAGPNAFWVKYDWNLAVQEGAAYSGVPFSGTAGFVNTVEYLRLAHQIAPKEQALLCNACHGVPSFWETVGLKDPLARPQ